MKSPVHLTWLWIRRLSVYKDSEYADSRLRGTVVLLNGTPVYVTRVNDDLTCTVRNDEDDDEGEFRVECDDLNVLAPKLGFVNSGGRALYLSRKPMRCDWRQGLRPAQITILTGRIGNRPTFRDIMKCLRGEYKKLPASIRLLSEGHSSVAISRELCLVKKRNLIEVHYCWRGRVGTLSKKVITLDGKHKHLSYLLEGL